MSALRTIARSRRRRRTADRTPAGPVSQALDDLTRAGRLHRGAREHSRSRAQAGAWRSWQTRAARAAIRWRSRRPRTPIATLPGRSRAQVAGGGRDPHRRRAGRLRGRPAPGRLPPWWPGARHQPRPALIASAHSARAFAAQVGAGHRVAVLVGVVLSSAARARVADVDLRVSPAAIARAGAPDPGGGGDRPAGERRVRHGSHHNHAAAMRNRKIKIATVNRQSRLRAIHAVQHRHDLSSPRPRPPAVRSPPPAARARPGARARPSPQARALPPSAAGALAPATTAGTAGGACSSRIARAVRDRPGGGEGGAGDRRHRCRRGRPIGDPSTGARRAERSSRCAWRGPGRW